MQRSIFCVSSCLSDYWTDPYWTDLRTFSTEAVLTCG